MEMGHGQHRSDPQAEPETAEPTAEVTEEESSAEGVDDGEVPEKQIQRWKNEGGAYTIPPE
jgi:hypothetical protein